MAKRQEFARLSVSIFRVCTSIGSKVSTFFVQASFFLIAISSASTQTNTQQYVYVSLPGSPPAAPSSLVSGFNQAGQTGALSAIPGSPFSDPLEGGLVAIDGQGKFLFILNPKNNNISMFRIDQASGALSEVPGSPFAVPPTINPSQAPSQPISITFGSVNNAVSGPAVSIFPTTANFSAVVGATRIQFMNGSTVADPMGPYIYSAQFANPTLIHAYQIALALLFLSFAILDLDKDRRAVHLAARKNPMVLYGVLSAAFFCITFAISGCGGGSMTLTTPPPPIVTPSGTSTITISLSATSSSGQPLQLQTIQLTLTVK